MASNVQTLQQPPPGMLERAGGALGRLTGRAGGVALPLLITGGAGFIRFWRLGSPHAIVPLDETYYAPNAFGYLCHGADMSFRAGARQTCAGLDPTFAVHPPVGKLLTAVGIKIFGYRPFGWRFAAAVVGTLAVLVVYGIGLRLWHKRWPAAVAATLVAVDGLEFVQSRLAMLDIFVAFFVLLGVWLALEDRARAPGWTGPRWWRLGAGVALGLAIASKWAAVPILPVVAAVAFAWEVSRIREARAAAREAEFTPLVGNGGASPDGPPLPAEEAFWNRGRPATPGRDSYVLQALGIVATFALIPAAVYIASYTPWFFSTKKYVPPRCNTVVTSKTGEVRSVPMSGLRLWYCDQKEIFDYHRNLKAVDDKGKPIHPYMSRAWSWPWISRPASHYFKALCYRSGKQEPCPPGETVRDQEILGLPNPAIWWLGFFVALPLCAFLTITRRDEVAALLVVLFLPLVVPWLVYSRPIFMFYMTPASPLLALMVTHAIQRWRLRWTAVAYVAIAIALFGYFYPVLAAYPLRPGGAFGWESRIWFGHGIAGDCSTDRIKLLCWI